MMTSPMLVGYLFMFATVVATCIYLIGVWLHKRKHAKGHIKPKGPLML